jgi:hypothetical protein
MSALAAAFEVAGVECRGWMIFRVPSGTERPHKSARDSRGRHWGMSSDPVEIEGDFQRWPEADASIGGFQPDPVDG